MIVRVVFLFLIAILVLAMFGRLRTPKIGRRKDKANKVGNARKCRKCGSYILGDGPCACERKQ